MEWVDFDYSTAQLDDPPPALTESKCPPVRTIAEKLAGAKILVTGSTGFLGGLVVEKLLWSAPSLGRLYLLIRPRPGRDAETRLREDVLSPALTRRLRTRLGADWDAWIRARAQAVPCDLSRENFGLSEEAYGRLAADVNLVVHAAADTSLDAPLDAALAVNARGTERVLWLARAAGAPFVHVSTCYAAAAREGPFGDPEVELQELEAAAAKVRKVGGRGAASLLGLSRSQGAGYRNVYELSKALAERIVARDSRGLAVAVVRPSILAAAHAEPQPRWSSRTRRTAPVLALYARGLLREFPGRPESILDVIPADFAANAVIAAAADVRERSAGLGVYQVCSSRRNPLRLGQLARYVQDSMFGRTAGAPPRRIRLLDEPVFFRRLRFRTAALALARRLLPFGHRWRRRLARAACRLSRLSRLARLYSPYTRLDQAFDDEGARGLWDALAASDRAKFPFDVSGLDWREYWGGRVSGRKRAAS